MMNFAELLRRAREVLSENDHLTVDELQAECEIAILEDMCEARPSKKETI